MQTYLPYEELVKDELYGAMQAIDKVVKSRDISPTLLGLIRIRVSQINRCAFCVDMHVKEAMARGETFQRIYSLAVWRETPFYSEEERALLSWTEALTLVSEQGIPDSIYQAIRTHFDSHTILNLTCAVNAINSWNRLMISVKREPGSYKPSFDFTAPTAAASR